MSEVKLTEAQPPSDPQRPLLQRRLRIPPAIFKDLFFSRFLGGEAIRKTNGKERATAAILKTSDREIAANQIELLAYALLRVECAMDEATRGLKCWTLLLVVHGRRDCRNHPTGFCPAGHLLILQLLGGSPSPIVISEHRHLNKPLISLEMLILVASPSAGRLALEKEGGE